MKRTAAMMGVALSAPAVVGIWEGCRQQPPLDWTPAFLTVDEAVTVSLVADVMIPSTDTPGALAAGVPQFIDTMLNDVYSQAEQLQFRDSLTQFNDAAKTASGRDFNRMEASQRSAFVAEKHAEALDIAPGAREKAFVLWVKALTVQGFFTSEPGATKVLQYAAVPGAYRGCLPLSEVGKTWAT